MYRFLSFGSAAQPAFGSHTVLCLQSKAVPKLPLSFSAVEEEKVSKVKKLRFQENVLTDIVAYTKLVSLLC